MKFKFYNLGTIEETELDLKPLTVIIGHNNSSKTYLAYSVYGLLKNLNRVFHNEEAINKVSALIEQKSDTVLSLKFDNRLVNVLIETFSDSIENFRKNLNSFFLDSSKKLFIRTKYQLDTEKLITKGSVQRWCELMPELSNRLYTTSKQENTLFFKLQNVSQLVDGLQVEQLAETGRTTSSIARIVLILSSIFPSPYLLPAERNNLILTYRHLEYSRLRNFKNISRRSYIDSLFSPEDEIMQSDIRYQEPIEDFLNSLLGLDIKEPTTNNEEVDYRTFRFAQIADKLERYIHNGQEIQVSSTKDKLNEEIKLKIKEGLIIDLHNASSSIKQLTPLVLYLRHFSQRSNLLIIDEPEMNLHPENQAKLLEILGMMVNAGIQVLITTHSPYFMSHLNTLAAGKTDDEDILKQQAQHLYLKDPTAFVSMDNISAYEMKDNKLVSLKDPDYGIRWDTLSDVSGDIQHKFFQIFDQGRASKNVKPAKKPSKYSTGKDTQKEE